MKLTTTHSRKRPDGYWKAQYQKKKAGLTKPQKQWRTGDIKELWELNHLTDAQAGLRMGLTANQVKHARQRYAEQLYLQNNKEVSMTRYNPDSKTVLITLRRELIGKNRKYLMELIREVCKSMLKTSIWFTETPGQIVIHSPTLTPDRAKKCIMQLDQHPFVVNPDYNSVMIKSKFR